MDKLPEFTPVKVKCTDNDCENDKHCYRPKRGQWKPDGVRGRCQACGDESVDMSIPRARDASNPQAIFAELGREFIRDYYLDMPIDEQGRRQLRREGVAGLKARVRSHLFSRIGKEPNAWDGRQTPFFGSVLNLAQHATATCCRKCTYYWYGIPREDPLNGPDLVFCETMVLAYLERREAELEEIAAGRGSRSGGSRGSD